jgi:hypothetical protein
MQDFKFQGKGSIKHGDCKDLIVTCPTYMNLDYIVAMLNGKITVHGKFEFDYPLGEDEGSDFIRFLSFLDLSQCKEISINIHWQMEERGEKMFRRMIRYALNENKIKYEIRHDVCE